MITLLAFKISKTAKIPTKAHTGPFSDAAYDLYCDSGAWLVGPSPQAVSTGIKLIIPDGYWVKFHEKSGKALKGLQIHGGVIDSGYTGELKVIISSHDKINGLVLNSGDAICQFTVEKLVESEVVDIVSKELFDSECEFRVRKDSGFGSTGQ